MKIAHAVGWYLPESVGGSELYVRGLCRELSQLGAQCVVLAPRDGRDEGRYRVDDVEVLRYPVYEAQADGRRRAPRHGGFERFGAMLHESKADVLHLHSVTYGCGVAHLAHARERGMKTVTTVHVPGTICLRSTLMHLGVEPCDGVIDVTRCGECWLVERGAPYPLARAATRALALGGGIATRLGERIPGRAGTAAAALSHAARKRQELQSLAESSQRVVAVCEWLGEALRANGVPEDKLVLCRQGVAAVDAARFGSAADPSGPLRIGYFGRADVVKGIDVVVRAVTARRELDVVLELHMIAKSDGERMELERLRGLARGDARITFLPPIPEDKVREVMRQCHAIAVPSRWLETGPMVVMEALAAGVPVLGSDLGGIAELVEPGVTGWLLPHDDVPAWSRELAALCAARALLPRFGVERVVGRLSTTAEVARSMLGLYESLA
jgi:glycosyltransferase involved in cell wall biosynthesis